MPSDDLQEALRRVLIEALSARPTKYPENESTEHASGKSPTEQYSGDASDGPRDLPARLLGVPEPERPSANQVSMLPNARANMAPGKLLLGVQKDNSVHLFDPKTGDFEIFCRFETTPMLLWRAVPAADGKIFVAMSGTRWPGHPTEVAFGQGGAIFHVDNKEEVFSVVPGSDRLVDPGELVVQHDGLIVVDFMGFGGSGKIYKINPITGDRSIIFEGEPLKEPVALALLPNGDFIIANAFMRYAPVTGPTGRKLKEMGALLRLDAATKGLSVLHDESDTPSGVIDSVAVDDQDSRFILYTRNDWPMQETGGLYSLNTETGERKLLKGATKDMSIFARVGPAIGDVAAVADSYNKILYTVDIKGAKVIEQWSLAPLLGPGRGMVTPLETVESLRWT